MNVIFKCGNFLWKYDKFCKFFSQKALCDIHMCFFWIIIVQEFVKKTNTEWNEFWTESALYMVRINW
jgi:hypothetical protein